MVQRYPNQAGGGQSTGGTAEAVPPVFNRTSPQALPEAPLGFSPSQYRYLFVRSYHCNDFAVVNYSYHVYRKLSG